MSCIQIDDGQVFHNGVDIVDNLGCNSVLVCVQRYMFRTQPENCALFFPSEIMMLFLSRLFMHLHSSLPVSREAHLHVQKSLIFLFMSCFVVRRVYDISLFPWPLFVNPSIQ